MLVGSYASTLLDISFGFPTYIRHGSSKKLFENLGDDQVTLGVAFFDARGHLKETVPTTHPFKKILDLAYFDQATMTEEIAAPSCNVTMNTMKALYEPMYHLYEKARKVETKWFALTYTYQIVKLSVSVVMEDDVGPNGAEYNDWKLSSPMLDITNEFVTKDKTRHGWRAWTSLWSPAPVDGRSCNNFYGVNAYMESL